MADRAAKHINRLLFCLAILLCVEPAAAVTVTDDTGSQVSLAEPASRIISLAPHLTELLFAAGAGEHIVGAVRYSDYPPAASNIPRIGDAHSFDLERILALEPDLIVGWQSGNPAGQIRHLQQLQLSLYISEPRTLEDIAVTMEELGRLAGTRAVAGQAAQNFRSRVVSLRVQYANRKPVSVFYQIWHEPLITIGGDHIINEVIRLCGGRNVFSGIGQLAPQISVEAVLSAKPEVIVASGTGNSRPAWLDDWRQWPQLPAVQNEQLHFISPDYLQRHTPRLLRGAETMCRILEQARTSSES